MAELNVQPKRANPWWIWLLVAIVLLGIIYYFSRGCDDAGTVTNGAPVSGDSVASATQNTADDNWSNVNFDAPVTSFEEITDTSISVRGNETYSIYGLGENILFETDKSDIRSEAAPNLKQIAASLNKRYIGGAIRVYGYTDAEGSAGYNKQLAEQRAASVRNWLVQNANIAEDRISMHPVGESRPIASNSTESGGQQNRRVEIVAMGANN